MEQDRLTTLLDKWGHAGDVYDVLVHDRESNEAKRILWFEKIIRSGEKYKVALSMELFQNYIFRLTLLKSNGLVDEIEHDSRSWLGRFISSRSPEFVKKLNNCLVEATAHEDKTLLAASWTRFGDISTIRLSQIGLNLCFIIFGN